MCWKMSFNYDFDSVPFYFNVNIDDFSNETDSKTIGRVFINSSSHDLPFGQLK